MPRTLVINARATTALVMAWASVCQPAVAQTDFVGLGFLPSSDSVVVSDLSADGSTVVGSCHLFTSDTHLAFRWTRASGMEDLSSLVGDTIDSASEVSSDGTYIVCRRPWFPGEPGGDIFDITRWSAAGGLTLIMTKDMTDDVTVNGISDDGSTVVLTTGGRGTYLALRWTEMVGMVVFPVCDEQHGGWARGADLSADAAVAVGQCYGYIGYACCSIAARWNTPDTAPETLPLPAGYTTSLATNASSDGSIVVGQVSDGEHGGLCLWTPSGMTVFGALPGDASARPTGVSDDGRVVVGTSTAPDRTTRAFIWTPEEGIRDLRDVLAASALDLSHWQLLSAVGISADGSTIAGQGRNPAGYTAGWIARLSGACRPDCNDDSKLNVNDFICFQSKWRTRQPYADYTLDSKFDINDFIAFQAGFRKGCP